MSLKIVFNISTVALAFFALTDLLLEGRKTADRKYVVMILILVTLPQTGLFLEGKKADFLLTLSPFDPFRHWTFLLGPLLFFYQQRAVGKSLKGVHLLHLLPFVLWYSVILLRFGGVPMSGEIKRVYGLTTLLSFGFYSLFILIRLRGHGKEMGDRVSYRDFYLELKWMSYIALSLFIITLFLGVLIPLAHKLGVAKIVRGSAPLALSRRIQLFHSMASFFFLFFFSLFALRQNRHVPFPEEVFPGDDNLNEEVGDEEEETPGEELPDRDAYETIRRYMQEERPYLNNELNLQGLADSLGMSRNRVSRTINLNRGENFFHFVNGFRAREFQVALKENRFPRYTLLAIGQECGFNSKSTFNEAVKREFGKTPSQLRKDLFPAP